jgi:hypothetical protein
MIFTVLMMLTNHRLRALSGTVVIGLVKVNHWITHFIHWISFEQQNLSNRQNLTSG